MLQQWKRMDGEDEDSYIRVSVRGASYLINSLVTWWRTVRSQVTIKEPNSTYRAEDITVSGGIDNDAQAGFSIIPGGTGAVVNLFGAAGWSAGRHVGAGSSQALVLQLRRMWTSGGAIQYRELWLDGASLQAVLPNNTVWLYTGLIVGWHENKGVHIAYGWRTEGMIKRLATAASTTLLQDGLYIIHTEAGAPADPYLDADTTNGALRIWCATTGTVGDVQRYSALLQLVQVGV